MPPGKETKMINRMFLVGRLVRDPEYFAPKEQGGRGRCLFRIASDYMRGKDGETKTLFIDCVCYGPMADSVSSYTHKGSYVVVSGRLEPVDWTAKDGSARSSYRISAEAVDFVSRQQDSGGSGAQPRRQAQSVPLDEALEDMPF